MSPAEQTPGDAGRVAFVDDDVATRVEFETLKT
jgi:hypothetical protein